MPLFTDPLTINDGTSDHVFTFKAQTTDKNSISGVWVEPLASLSTESKLNIKHDEAGATVRRRLLQRRVNKPIVDFSLQPLTINVTITHHKEHTLAQINAELTLLKDAISEVTFPSNFLQGLI